MPQGTNVDPETIIAVINDHVAEHGDRPTAPQVAAQLNISPKTVSAVIVAFEGTNRIDGDRRKGGRRGPDIRQSCLDTIRDYTLAYGWAPSQREIATKIGCPASKVNQVIARLAAEGLIEVGPDSRQINIVGSVMKIPEVTL